MSEETVAGTMVRIRFGEQSAAAILVDAESHEHVLDTSGEISVDTYRSSPQAAVPVAVAAAATALAHLTGVVTGADILEVTLPSGWTRLQATAIGDAAVTAGYAPDRIVIRVSD